MDVLSVLMVLLLLTRADAQLLCYTCDDCETVDELTPTEICLPDTITTTEPTSCTGDVGPTFPSSTTEEVTPPTHAPTTSTTEEATTSTTEEDTTSTTEEATTSTTEEATTSTTEEATTSTTEEASTSMTTEIGSPRSESSISASQSPFRKHLVFYRSKRSLASRAASGHCYSIQVKDTATQTYKTKRGCVAVKSEEDACEKLRQENGEDSRSCRVCTKDMCNASSTLGSFLTIPGLLILCLINKSLIF